MFYSCAPVAARSAAHGVRAARGRKSLTVDVHCHVCTLAAEAMVEDIAAPEVDPLMRFANDITREVNRKPAADIRDQITRIGPRLEAMDKMGIDMRALSVAPPQYFYWTEPELGRALTRVINDDIWGAEHIVLGTDYPYDMGDYDPLGSIAAVKQLTAAERVAIAGENAARLLGIRRRPAVER